MNSLFGLAGSGHAALLTVIGFLFVLTVVVFFHELGHYWVARWFGVGAEAFSIGFGKELFGWTDKRGTRWRVAALPLRLGRRAWRGLGSHIAPTIR